MGVDGFREFCVRVVTDLNGLNNGGSETSGTVNDEAQSHDVSLDRPEVTD